MKSRYSPDAIAITGMGVVCPLGQGVAEVWRGVVEGHSGIREVTSLDISRLSFRYAGEIAVLDLSRCPEPFGEDWVDRASQLTMLAAVEAVGQAGIDPASIDPYRFGIALGSCQAGLDRLGVFLHDVHVNGHANADPAPLLSYPLNTPADHLSVHYGLRGPKYILSNACAAGASAIGIAADALRAGRVDAMIAGGVDPLEIFSLAGFDSLQAVDNRPCAPYSRSDGINVGEGAAIVVLERIADAQRRGAEILAYVGGYGLSSDAHHATAPDPAGSGASRAMTRALRQAGLEIPDVGYVNGHGTGTPANDKAEKAAMGHFFGDRAASVPLSSTKSQIGHTLGAAGAIEAIVCVQAIRESTLPPTISFDHERVDVDLDFVPDKGRPQAVSTTLSNSFAFGGANCSVAITSTPRRGAMLPGDEPVVITGVGLISSLGVGMQAFVDALASGAVGIAPIRGFDTHDYAAKFAGEITDRTHLRHIDPSYARRLDQVGRLTVASSRMAAEHGRLRLAASARERAGLIMGTCTGPAETIGAVHHSILVDGPDKVNPRMFPNTVMNAAAGHACLSLQLKGPTCTVVTGYVAGITAIAYAADLIRQGEADVMFATVADEFTRELHGGYDRLGLLSRSAPRPYDVCRDGGVLAAGGCSLLLESLSHAQARGATILGEVLGHAITSDAYRVAGMEPCGAAWSTSFRMAMEDAGVEPDEVGCVYGEGRGGQVADLAELHAMERVFGSSGVRLAALSPQTGHAQGTMGPFGVVAALESLRTGWVPDIAGLTRPVPEMGATRWSGPARDGARAAMVTSVASGATYATLVLGGAPS